MREIILCKYGEIALKGANRTYFETLLRRNLKRRISKYGKFNIYALQSTVYIEPLDEDCDITSAYETAMNTFGVAAVSRAFELEKDMDKILEAVPLIIPEMRKYKTFKVEAKRSDKKFPLESPEICSLTGGKILEEMHGAIKVDVRNPQTTVRVEIRDKNAFLCAGQERAVGGMPVGSNGNGLLLLSGGIDSPVSGYMMAKRGIRIDALHFESFPYTSERARLKVLSLAEKLTDYCGDINVHIISLTHIQEVLRDSIDEDYFTLLLRRYMMTIAERVAKYKGCTALITGESLGQVASQTMQALGVTDICVKDMPVFRPCIGMDKEEIVTISRKMGAFETSILPYEDCCTVFTPKHPKTKPELEKVLVQENKLDFEALADEAFNTLYTVTVEAKY